MSRAEALPRLSYRADKPANGWLRAMAARLPHALQAGVRPASVVRRNCSTACFSACGAAS